MLGGHGDQKLTQHTSVCWNLFQTTYPTQQTPTKITCLIQQFHALQPGMCTAQVRLSPLNLGVLGLPWRVRGICCILNRDRFRNLLPGKRSVLHNVVSCGLNDIAAGLDWVSATHMTQYVVVSIMFTSKFVCFTVGNSWSKHTTRSVSVLNLEMQHALVQHSLIKIPLRTLKLRGFVSSKF